MNHEEKMNKIMDTLCELDGNRYFAEYDGGDDNRIFLEMQRPETLKLTKEEYEIWEEAVNTTEIIKDKFEIYMATDVSGYEYWTEGQEEDNYHYITIQINDSDMNEDEIHEMYNDIYKAIDIFEDKIKDVPYITYFGDGY